MKLKIYSSEYMRASSKGQMWIPGFLALGFLMAFPVYELLMMGSWFGMEYEYAQIELLYERLWKSGFLFTGFTIIILAGITNGINGFWYLYSSKKVDFYHSLPITRKKLFWQKTSLGFFYFFFPYLVFWFMSVCIGAMRGFFSLHLMGLAAKMMFIHLVLYFMVYFMTVLVITVTGNILMGFLTLASACFYGPILGILIWMYIKFFFVTGFESEYGIQSIFIKYGSPLTLGMTFLQSYSNRTKGYLFIVVLAVMLILGGLSYIAYIKRKAENAGKPVVYRWLGIVLKFLVVVPGGLGCGLIFYMMPVETSKIPWWIFGMIFGTILLHGVIEIIYRMDFRGFFASKLQLMLAGCLVALIASIYQFDLLHFDSYLPSKEKLAAVNVDMNEVYGENVTFYNVIKTKDNTYQFPSWMDKENEIRKTGDNFDSGIYMALSQIVDKQQKDRDWAAKVPVRYTLDSGRTVYRRYGMSEGDIREFLLACLGEGKIREQKYSFLSIDPKYLEWFSCTFYDGSSYTLFQNDDEKYQQILDALRKDVQEADKEELLGIPCMKLYFQYENLPTESEDMLDTSSDTSYYYTSLWVFPTFERTIDILKETGYPVSGKDVEYQSVEMSYYPSNQEDSYTVEYTDKAQIDEIKRVMLPADLCPRWIKEDSSIVLNCYQDNVQNSTYAYLPKAEVPQFIKEDIENYEKNSAS